MNGLCTNCQVYFPMPPDFGDGVPYACPQCNALLVPMEEAPPAAPAPPPPVEPAPPPPAEVAAPPVEPAPPPPAEVAAPPVEPAPPPTAEVAPPAPATAEAPPPPAATAPAGPDQISTEEVTLPPVTPLDPPPEPAPAPAAAPAPPADGAGGAAAAPIALTAKDDEPESITLITAVPDEVKEIMAQKAAAASDSAAAAGGGLQPSGPLPDAGTPKAAVLWFHPKTSPEVEVARSRRPAAEPAPAPVSSSFSMSGAGNGVAVEDLSGLSIPTAAPAPEAASDRMATTVDTGPPGGGSAEPELVDPDDVVEAPAAEESSSYVQKGGIRDEIPGARPKTPPAATADAESKPATSTPPGTKPPKSTARPKITTATVKPVRQGGMGKWAAIILLIGLVGGGAFVVFAMPELLPASIREAIHGTDPATDPGGETAVAGTEGEIDPDPAAGTEADPGTDEAAEAVVAGEGASGDEPGTEGEAGDDPAAGTEADPGTDEAAEAIAAGEPDTEPDPEPDPEAGTDEAVAEAMDEPPADEAPVEVAAASAADRRAAAAEKRARRRAARERRARAARSGTETTRVTRTGTATTAAKTETPEPKPPADDPKAKAKDHVRAGNSFLKQGKVDQAIAQYEKAILLDGRSAAAHRGLGVAYASLGRAREAVREYELYLKLAPKARDAAQVKKIIDQYYASQKPK